MASLRVAEPQLPAWKLILGLVMAPATAWAA